MATRLFGAMALSSFNNDDVCLSIMMRVTVLYIIVRSIWPMRTLCAVGSSSSLLLKMYERSTAWHPYKLTLGQRIHLLRQMFFVLEVSKRVAIALPI